MGIVAFLIVGLIAGWLAGKIVEGHGFGTLGDIIVGIIGAFIGGLLSDQVLGVAYGFWGSVLTATIGAVILLFLVNLFTGTKAKI